MTDAPAPAQEQGLSLTDIGPLRELIPVGSKKLAVTGISAEGILALFNRFPELREWALAGKVTLTNLQSKAPDALKAIIAAGCGQPGDAKAEAVAGSWPVELQLDILEAIGRLTFTNGFGPFVNRIVALAAQARSVNYGRAPGMPLPQTSNPLPPSGEAPNPSGS